MRFEIDAQQSKMITEWYESVVLPEILSQQKDMNPMRTCNGTQPYAGAIGGGMTYRFTPTGLGIVTTVHCGLT